MDNRRPRAKVKIEPAIDGVACPAATLVGPAVETFASLNLILNDIIVAEGLLQAAEVSSKDFEQSFSLFAASVVTYAKAFTNCLGRSYQLDARSVFSGFDFYRKTHDDLMEIRNEYISHGGKSLHEQINVLAILSPNRDQPELLKISSHIVMASGVENESKKMYLDCIRHVRQHVEEKAKASFEHVKEEAERIPISELYANADAET